MRRGADFANEVQGEVCVEKCSPLKFHQVARRPSGVNSGARATTRLTMSDAPVMETQTYARRILFIVCVRVCAFIGLTETSATEWTARLGVWLVISETLTHQVHSLSVRSFVRAFNAID